MHLAKRLLLTYFSLRILTRPSLIMLTLGPHPLSVCRVLQFSLTLELSRKRSMVSSVPSRYCFAFCVDNPLSCVLLEPSLARFLCFLIRSALRVREGFETVFSLFAITTASYNACSSITRGGRMRLKFGSDLGRKEDSLTGVRPKRPFPA